MGGRYIIGTDGVPYGPFLPAHEAPDAVLTRLEADRLRARALELVAASDTLDLMDSYAVAGWVGSASVILAELARG